MKTEIGEYIVGAYLKMIENCNFVDYNVRPPGGGIKGLAEFDVLGLNFESKTAYLCEVTTHILGLLYGKGPDATVNKVKDKHKRQKEYARKYLKDFETVRFMFWSPIVSRGKLSERLTSIKGLELVINEDYTAKVDQLRSSAGEVTHDTGNPFFRTLQILERLRK